VSSSRACKGRRGHHSTCAAACCCVLVVLAGTAQAAELVAVALHLFLMLSSLVQHTCHEHDWHGRESTSDTPSTYQLSCSIWCLCPDPCLLLYLGTLLCWLCLHTFACLCLGCMLTVHT
jgi:hypothetical protein